MTTRKHRVHTLETCRRPRRAAAEMSDAELMAIIIRGPRCNTPTPEQVQDALKRLAACSEADLAAAEIRHGNLCDAMREIVMPEGASRADA